MKNIAILVLILMLSFSVSHAQSFVESSRLVDLPTAYTLERASYKIDLRTYTNGGLLGSVSIGITERVMLGMSYGGENLIGQGTVNWNPEPGIEARVRVIDETFTIPGVSVGFESQGYGPYLGEPFNRYETKSRGLLIVASKNYAILNNLAIHAGVNWSLEQDDKDREINFFMGGDLILNPEFHVFMEYDFANNDNENDQIFGSGRGYFNGGLRWTFSNQLYLQFNFKNIFQNGPENVRREFRVGYFEYL